MKKRTKTKKGKKYLKNYRKTKVYTTYQRLYQQNKILKNRLKELGVDISIYADLKQ